MPAIRRPARPGCCFRAKAIIGGPFGSPSTQSIGAQLDSEQDFWLSSIKVGLRTLFSCAVRGFPHALAHPRTAIARPGDILVFVRSVPVVADLAARLVALGKRSLTIQLIAGPAIHLDSPEYPQPTPVLRAAVHSPCLRGGALCRGQIAPPDPQPAAYAPNSERCEPSITTVQLTVAELRWLGAGGDSTTPCFRQTGVALQLVCAVLKIKTVDRLIRRCSPVGAGPQPQRAGDR